MLAAAATYRTCYKRLQIADFCNRTRGSIFQEEALAVRPRTQVAAARPLPTPTAVVGAVYRTANRMFSSRGFFPRTTGRPIRREVRVAGGRSQIEAGQPGATPEVVREAVCRTTRRTFSSWGFLPRTTGSTFRLPATGAVARLGSLSGPEAEQKAGRTCRRTRQSRDSERHSSCRIAQPLDLRESVRGQPHRVAAMTETHMPAATAGKAELAARR